MSVHQNGAGLPPMEAKEGHKPLLQNHSSHTPLCFLTPSPPLEEQGLPYSCTHSALTELCKGPDLKLSTHNVLGLELAQGQY